MTAKYVLDLEHVVPSLSMNFQADYGGVLSYEETALGVLTAKRSCGQKIKAAGFVNIGLNYKWIKEIVERLSVGKETVG